MERKVIFSDDVEILLDELLIALYTKSYFSFLDNAIAYVESITYYAVQYIGIIPSRDAPIYFERYGSNLRYITYKANKSTSWYIFYQQRNNVFLIRHITNNHVAAKFFNH